MRRKRAVNVNPKGLDAKSSADFHRRVVAHAGRTIKSSDRTKCQSLLVFVRSVLPVGSNQRLKIHAGFKPIGFRRDENGWIHRVLIYIIPAHVRFHYIRNAGTGPRGIIGIHAPDRLGMQIRHTLVRGSGVGVHLVHHVHRVIVGVTDDLLSSVPRRHFLLMNRHRRLIFERLEVLQKRLPDLFESVGIDIGTADILIIQPRK